MTLLTPLVVRAGNEGRSGVPYDPPIVPKNRVVVPLCGGHFPDFLRKKIVDFLQCSYVRDVP